MSADSNQGWSFFWAAPDVDYEETLADEREYRRRIIYRCVFLASILSEQSREDRPLAN